MVLEIRDGEAIYDAVDNRRHRSSQLVKKWISAESLVRFLSAALEGSKREYLEPRPEISMSAEWKSLGMEQGRNKLIEALLAEIKADGKGV